MIAFDVSLNGQHLATAGAENLCIITVHIDAIGRCGTDVNLEKERNPNTEITFAVDGMTSTYGMDDKQHPTWVRARTLAIGDVVLIKVIDSSNATPALSGADLEFDERLWKPCFPEKNLAFKIRSKSGYDFTLGRNDMFMLNFCLSAQGTLGSKSLGVDFQRSRNEPPGFAIDVMASGVTKRKNPKEEERLLWIEFDKLKLGDEFEVTICDVLEADPPRRSEPWNYGVKR